MAAYILVKDTEAKAEGEIQLIQPWNAVTGEVQHIYIYLKKNNNKAKL